MCTLLAIIIDSCIFSMILEETLMNIEQNNLHLAFTERQDNNMRNAHLTDFQKGPPHYEFLDKRKKWIQTFQTTI